MSTARTSRRTCSTASASAASARGSRRRTSTRRRCTSSTCRAATARSSSAAVSGIGGQREHDMEGLRRLYEHLEPGGTLVLDNEVPYADKFLWPYWSKEKRQELPRAWRDTGDRRPIADGTELELRSRVVEMDPLAQRVAIEMRAFHWGGRRARRRGAAQDRDHALLHARARARCSSGPASSISRSAAALGSSADGGRRLRRLHRA